MLDLQDPDRSLTPAARHHAQLMNDLRDPLTILSGRVRLLRRRLAAEDIEAARLGLDLETMQVALVRLITAVDRLDAEFAEPPMP
ncbi:MAG: hypothetical protein M3144_01510 [Actinomycetota bacterium]|nr:hypothetical protein [Actinomycetota bacterium]